MYPIYTFASARHADARAVPSRAGGGALRRTRATRARVAASAAPPRARPSGSASGPSGHVRPTRSGGPKRRWRKVAGSPRSVSASAATSEVADATAAPPSSGRSSRVSPSPAMVPESLAFTFVAGVSPICGLHAAALLGSTPLSARPGVIRRGHDRGGVRTAGREPRPRVPVRRGSPGGRHPAGVRRGEARQAHPAGAQHVHDRLRERPRHRHRRSAARVVPEPRGRGAVHAGGVDGDHCGADKGPGLETSGVLAATNPRSARRHRPRHAFANVVAPDAFAAAKTVATSPSPARFPRSTCRACLSTSTR